MKKKKILFHLLMHNTHILCVKQHSVLWIQSFVFFSKMENVKNIRIDFHNDKLTYKPGESIVGCVNFLLTKDTEIDSVKVKFYGSANVHW